MTDKLDASNYVVEKYWLKHQLEALERREWALDVLEQWVKELAAEDREQ